MVGTSLHTLGFIFGLVSFFSSFYKYPRGLPSPSVALCLSDRCVGCLWTLCEIFLSMSGTGNKESGETGQIWETSAGLGAS